MIEVSNVAKRYGDFTAVSDVSFDVQLGEIFGLLGENGAGKTTTIRMISTIIKPTSGEIRVQNLDVSKDPEDVRRSIGVVTNSAQTYERLTVRENLELFGSFYNFTKKQLAEKIDSLVARLNLEPHVKKYAGNLSQGNKQKVTIARAIIGNPPVLIFDEPMNGLDVAAQQTVRELLEELRAEGKAVLFTTHIMSDVERLSDRIAIIHQGRITYRGQVQDIPMEERQKTLERLVMEGE